MNDGALDDQVHIAVGDAAVVLRPVSNARTAWVAAFERLGGEEGTFIQTGDGVPNDFDEEEWTWP